MNQLKWSIYTVNTVSMQCPQSLAVMFDLSHFSHDNDLQMIYYTLFLFSLIIRLWVLWWNAIYLVSNLIES